MKLLLIIISSSLGSQEDTSDHEETGPWWNVSRRTPNSEIDYGSTTSIPALSLFNYDNNSFKQSNTTGATEFDDNVEEILSPFLVSASTNFEESDLKNNLNRSPLLGKPDFNNILDAEEIFSNREYIEDIHDVDAVDSKYLVSSVNGVVDNSDFEKRLMTRLKHLLGLSMSGEVTGHGGSVHGRDFYPFDCPEYYQ